LSEDQARHECPLVATAFTRCDILAEDFAAAMPRQFSGSIKRHSVDEGSECAGVFPRVNPKPNAASIDTQKIQKAGLLSE